MTSRHVQTQVTDAQARKSALLVAGVLAGIAAWNLYRHRPTYVAIFGGLAVALALTGLLLPPLARQFHIYWMKLAGLLGYVNSRILLTLLFYGVFTPYRIVSRLFGRDPLTRRGGRLETYWTPRKNTRQLKEQFERLF